ncbi:DUF4907 domain-containing protein [Chryseolinea sp. T2]|uniref:DUF4907 domain-containing protein n=1 Tax=Chryseolinea sp. T2 TaxID=3129255 RepID=UPI00307757B6
MRSIYVVLLAALMFGCGKQEKETAAEQSAPLPDSASVAPPSNFRYQIIEAPENTFGYDVYRDDALFIHQPHVPGVSGVKGFEQEGQAKKAAELMIDKMKNGVVPPTLSEEEIANILKN